MREGVSAEEPVRLNLGAGGQSDPGWIAYDRSRGPLIARSHALSKLAAMTARRGGSSTASWAWPPDTRVHDVTRGIPHASGSVDAIYSSHMLEHLTRQQARFLVRECYRVLKAGGSLRLVVPDLEVLVHAYIADDRTILAADEPTAADAFVEGLGLREARSENPLIRVAQRVLRSDVGGHRWMYDGTSLAHLVREAGFVDVARVDFGQGRDAAAASLDHRSPFHVHLEAFRPATDLHA